MYKKVITAFLLVLIITLLPVTSSAEPVQDVIYQVDESHPPFEFSTDNEVHGFGMDLGRMIFGAGNYNVQYSSDTWSKVYNRIINGEIDVCGLLVVTEARKKDILFTIPVLRTYRAIYTRKNVQLENISDMAHYRIGVQASDYSETILKTELGINNYMTFNDLEQCILAMKDGSIDVVFGNQEVTNYLLVKHQASSYVTPKILNLYPTDLAFGVNKTKPELVHFMNAQLRKIQSSGLYEQVFQKHFYRHSEFYRKGQQRSVILLCLFLLIVIIIGMLFFNVIIRQLRKMVGVATSSLQEEHKLLRITLSNISDGVIAVDDTNRITFMNHVAEMLTGFTEKESVDKPLDEIFMIMESESGERYNIPIREVLEQGHPVNFSDLNILVSENGSQHLVLGSASPIKNDEDTVLGALVTFQDISEKMKSQETIKYHEYYDSLTKLPNRKLFHQYLSSAVENAVKTGCKLAVMIIDLDYFKNVNNTLGHTVGDKLLQQTSSRLIGLLDKNEVLARMGGDEFTILMPQVDDPSQAYDLAARVLSTLNCSYIIDHHEMYITASIGISICPDDATEPAVIMKHADTALYNAKASGRNTYQSYMIMDDEKVMQRFALTKDLHTALERNEMILYYQPKIDSLSETIIGMEALIRWKHPERGILTPGEFIPLAEEIGLIQKLDSWVLEAACSRFMSLDTRYRENLRLSVNLSAYQFRNRSLADNIEQVLSNTRFPHSQLELEITETTAMENIDYTIKTLKRLNEMGVNISVDDFGTGYSSLNYLRYLPIHILKIDRSFINDIDKDLNTRVIVKSIIDVAHSLKLKVTAEGVESTGQLDLLKQMGCDEIQGYLISRPAPMEEILKKISDAIV